MYRMKFLVEECVLLVVVLLALATPLDGQTGRECK